MGSLEFVMLKEVCLLDRAKKFFKIISSLCNSSLFMTAKNYCSD